MFDIWLVYLNPSKYYNYEFLKESNNYSPHSAVTENIYCELLVIRPSSL